MALGPSNDTHNVENGCKEDESITTYHNPPTFILQTLYFLIKLVENVSAVLFVTFYCKISNNSIFETFPKKVGIYTLFAGTLISWFSHILYYRLHGHPWKFANGPTVNFGSKKNEQKYFKADMYVLGQHKTFKTKRNSEYIIIGKEGLDTNKCRSFVHTCTHT